MLPIKKNLSLHSYPDNFLKSMKYIGMDISNCLEGKFNDKHRCELNTLFDSLRESYYMKINKNPESFLFKNRQNIRFLVIQVDGKHPNDDDLECYSRCSLDELCSTFSSKLFINIF